MDTDTVVSVAPTVRPMSRRSLSVPEQELVRTALRVLLEQVETQVALAKLLDVKQQHLSSILAGKSAGGYGLARSVARAMKVTDVDGWLLGREPSVAIPEDLPAWGNLAGYREAERELRKARPERYAEWTYLGGRRVRGVTPLEIPVTVAALTRLLNWVEENTRNEDVREIEAARQDKQFEADRKRLETRAKNAAAKKAATEAKRPKLPEGKR